MNQVPMFLYAQHRAQSNLSCFCLLFLLWKKTLVYWHNPETTSCSCPAASGMAGNCFSWIIILVLNYFNFFDVAVRSESIVMSSLSLVVFRDDRWSRMVTIRLQLSTFPHTWDSTFLCFCYTLLKIKFIGVTFQRMTSSWTATSAEMRMSGER